MGWVGSKLPQSQTWTGRDHVRHGSMGGHGPKPETTPLPMGQPPPSPPWKPRGHKVHVNLHIRLIPQDTGLVGGALGESGESQGHMPTLRACPRVTARGPPQACQAGLLTLLLPPEMELEEEETEAQSGEGTGPALKPLSSPPQVGLGSEAEAHLGCPGSPSSVIQNGMPGRPLPRGLSRLCPAGRRRESCRVRGTREWWCALSAGGNVSSPPRLQLPSDKGESPGTERPSNSPKATQQERIRPVPATTLAWGSRPGTALSWLGNGLAHTLGFPALNGSKGHVSPGSAEA